MKKEIDLDLSEFIGLTLVDLQPNEISFDKAILEVFCPWRFFDQLIFMNARVLEDKHNQEEARKIIQEYLIGRKINSIKIYEYPCDIKITFDNAIILEVFPDHPVYESWNFRIKGKEGMLLVGIPGGKVRWFLKKE